MTTTPQAAQVLELVALELDRIADDAPISGNVFAQARVRMAADRIRNEQAVLAKLQPAQAGELPDEREALIDDLAKWEAHVRRYDAEGDCNPLGNTLQQARAALSARKPAVPMTDDRIGEEWFDIYSLNISNLDKARLFARAIERAHGIGLTVKP